MAKILTIDEKRRTVTLGLKNKKKQVIYYYPLKLRKLQADIENYPDAYEGTHPTNIPSKIVKCFDTIYDGRKICRNIMDENGCIFAQPYHGNELVGRYFYTPRYKDIMFDLNLCSTTKT